MGLGGDGRSGAGSATGLVRLTPGFYDAGTASGDVLVSDGVSHDGALLSIAVMDVSQPPVLAPPTDMTVEAGGEMSQGIQATDPDGGFQLELILASAPPFVTLSSVDRSWGAATSMLRVVPDYSDIGVYTATVRAFDGGLSDEKSSRSRWFQSQPRSSRRIWAS